MSSYYQTASFFIPGGHFDRKNKDFWEAGKCSDVVSEVSCCHKKILSDFPPPLLEQLVKFVLKRNTEICNKCKDEEKLLQY